MKSKKILNVRSANEMLTTVAQVVAITTEETVEVVWAVVIFVEALVELGQVVVMCVVVTIITVIITTTTTAIIGIITTIVEEVEIRATVTGTI